MRRRLSPSSHCPPSVTGRQAKTRGRVRARRISRRSRSETRSPRTSNRSARPASEAMRSTTPRVVPAEGELSDRGPRPVKQPGILGPAETGARAPRASRMAPSAVETGPRTDAEQGEAPVGAACFAAGLLVAQLVAAKATRDGFFL